MQNRHETRIALRDQFCIFMEKGLGGMQNRYETWCTGSWGFSQSRNAVQDQFCIFMKRGLGGMQNRHETTNRGAGLVLYFHEKRFGRHAKQIRNLVHGQFKIFTATKCGAGSVWDSTGARILAQGQFWVLITNTQIRQLWVGTTSGNETNPGAHVRFTVAGRQRQIRF